MTTTEALAERAKHGDESAADELYSRFDVAIRAITSPYTVKGADRDDLLQAARLGILGAIRNYDPSRGVPFAGLADVAIKRAVYTAVKMGDRRKHDLLTFAARSAVSEDGEVVDVLDFVALPASDPADILIAQEELRDVSRAIRVELSPLEAHALILFGNDLSYDEIADVLGVTSKTIDRAIQRARWKLNGEGPPSKPRAGKAVVRTVYECPRCSHETVKRKRGRGRPPVCNVCSLRQRIAA